MSRYGKMIASTVARAIGLPCTIVMDGVRYPFLATRTLVETDEVFLTEERIISDNIIRVPKSSLIRRPSAQEVVTFDGQPFRVLVTHERNEVYLVELTTWTPGVQS